MMKHLDTDNTHKWEKNFDQWVKTTPRQANPTSMLPGIYNRIESTSADELLDWEIDDLFAIPTVKASDQFLSGVKARLEQKESKIIRFPQILRWATPLAAAVALSFALVQQHKVPHAEHQPVVQQVSTTQTSVSSFDPELVQIFALASNLQSDTNITNMADSMETFAMFVD